MIMVEGWMRAALTMAVAMLVVLSAGTAWGADCGDTTGAGGTDVPCRCGDTVTTNTTLTASDPVVSTGVADVCTDDSALSVNGGVTLDGAAATLRCDGTGGDGLGVEIVGDGATVKNLAVRNCSTAVFGFTSGSTISGILAVSNAAGIALFGDGNAVTRSVVDGGRDANSTVGILISGNDNTLTGNRCQDNGFDGITGFGDRNVLARNNCLRNGFRAPGFSNGIFFFGTDNAFAHNQARANEGAGVRVSGDDNTTDGRNYAHGNTVTPQCTIDDLSTTRDGRYC
jgi:parallel beta-helix repeat protein